MEAHESESRPIDPDGTSTRGSFIRNLGVTLAAATGIAVLFPGVARATTNCCRNDSCGPCSGGSLPYYCTCPGGNFCVCHAPQGDCYLGGC
jgi:hypothetical protein